MIGIKVSVPVMAIVDTKGMVRPAAFIWEGMTFTICYVIREYSYPTEGGNSCGNRVFYCRTGCGDVHLYFYMGKWYVHREE